MKILISNDDGYSALGIQTIINKLSVEHQILVVAPDRNRSGSSSSITLDIPIRIEEVLSNRENKNVKIYSCTGTPVDCVKLGLEELAIKELGGVPDLVVSGINHGVNLGNDIFYSGTVAAAMEGAFKNIPSIACSHSIKPTANFELAGDILVAWIDTRLAENIKRFGNLFNINIPSYTNTNIIKGFKTTQQGIKSYVNVVDKRKDPSNQEYYWLHGTADLKLDINSAFSDVIAHSEGYVSITPLKLNLTKYE